MSTELGDQILEILKILKPAKLVDRSKDLEGVETTKDRGSISFNIDPYRAHVAKNCERGEPWISDIWSHGFYFFVAVPEIVEWRGVTYFSCRWWSQFGFLSSLNCRRGTVDLCPDGATSSSGYVIYKQGKGYQPNSQYFVRDDGQVFAYRRDVHGHDPVWYQPVGGANVGWTETILHDDLVQLTDIGDLREVLVYLQQSVESFQKESPRTIMAGYFEF